MSRVGIRRAYEAPGARDGKRILIDRVWPRGVKREDLALHAWTQDLAPSTELRKWFGHAPQRWEEFRERYHAELEQEPAASALAELRALVKRGRVTLVYGAKEERFNNAVALRELLEAS